MKSPSPLVAIAFKAPAKKAKAAPVAVRLPAQYKEPSPAEALRDGAHREKRHATESWIRGDMTTAKHNEVHRRADRVIANPHQFVGKKK